MTRPALASIVATCAVLALIPALAGDPKPAEDVAPIEKFSADQRQHWAYQRPMRSDLPPVKDAAWVRNPVDRFIRAAQEAVDFRPSPEAGKVELIRRLTFDLHGLPPTPEEVEAFVLDNRADAFERLVDRLLASPRYGERWAQHWLDLAHYADSNGFELDAERPDAWRYRDWVVRALNEDMPYNRFVTLQLAGDEVQPGDASALVATGFGRCGPREVVSGNIDPAVRRQSELTEVTGTVGSVFLGMTVACARCHNHKFDALPTTDYYRLQSFFAGSKFIDVKTASKAAEEAFAAAEEAIAKRVAPFKKQMADLEAPYRTRIKAEKEASLTAAEKALLAIPDAKRTPTQKRMAAGLTNSLRITWEDVAEAVSHNSHDQAIREQLKREIHRVEITLPPPPARAMALVDESPKPPETFVLKRGQPKVHGPKVEPRPPGIVLVSQPKEAFGLVPPTEKSPRRRTALAAWITRPDNPLTARVIVNRLWMHHFGRGIVATPSDFGVRGEAPSHPELLDWLATELISGGWHLKPIHRLLVCSAAYRQGSVRDPKQVAEDSENTLVWRMPPRRLDAEAIRDAMLAVTGELNPKMGGPGVLAPIEKEVEELIFTEAEVVDLWPETPDRVEHNRRSLYLFRKRNVRYPLFDAFDAPDTQSACAQRTVSTHALQALITLNSDFAIDRARALAGRICRETTSSRRVELAYRLVLAREPSPGELGQASVFVDAQSKLLRESGRKDAEAAAWVDYCLAMLNRNEFLYVP
jgi:hypothetical protein